MIEDGDIGILVPPAFHDPLEISPENLWSYCTTETPINLELLAEALVEFYANLRFWKSTGQASRQKLLRCFTSNQATLHYRQIFEAAVYAHGGRWTRPVRRGATAINASDG